MDATYPWVPRLRGHGQTSSRLPRKLKKKVKRALSLRSGLPPEDYLYFRAEVVVADWAHLPARMQP